MVRRGMEGEPPRGARSGVPARRLFKALGEDPKKSLQSLVDKGLTDTEIATRLTGDDPVTRFAVKKSRLHFGVKRSTRGRPGEKTEGVIFKAPEPKPISQGQIAFLVRDAAIEQHVKLSEEEIAYLVRSFTPEQKATYTMVDILVATGRSKTSSKARVKGKALVDELKAGNNGKLSLQEGIVVAVRLRVMPQKLPSYEPPDVSTQKPRKEGKRRGRPPGSRNYDGFNSGASRYWD